jgi:hypothetical protein
MAGDWIKMQTNLDTNPKIFVIAEALDIDPIHAVGCMWKLWSWADMHSIDGNAMTVTVSTIDKLVGVTGFALALKKVCWLVGEDGCLSLPKFEEHNGKTAKNRANTKDRVEKCRNAVSVTQALPEKRREEKNKKPMSDVITAGFEDFWKTWPSSERKVAKSKCFERWHASGHEEIAAQIIAHVASLKNSKQWRDGYDPAPLTYLNQTRWLDGDTQSCGNNSKFAGAK